MFDDLQGTYRGFSPTDESAVGLGEIEVIFSEDGVRIRLATGLEIEEYAFATTQCRELAKHELDAAFHGGYDDLLNARGVECASDSLTATLYHLTALDEGAQSVLAVQLGYAPFGPSMLFSPSELAEGRFERSVRELEDQVGVTGVVPLLANNGLAAANA